ncbi:three-Cys-motif partner protein TcmP [Tianweitania sediminis]|uniref:Three-Cys-motif partner protein TcmP n=1 Tax=Tianweitania sediminis TaxID=1502156 RepID=A0A8J7UKI7_9HYPH|nr:three-Cys-motif partner protein TcmP [Tianweitania sediminis]MBP0439905.1 three-Cys-motif partner protein TcmP [Tianweitania sediminis]
MKPEYADREQTLAKHFILGKYLQTLAYKILQGKGHLPLTYVDAFSGPWESKTTDFSDTSFMIAIRTLKQVHAELAAAGRARPIRCFFVEQDVATYSQLQAAVSVYNDPSGGFEIATFHGRFEDAVPHILRFVGRSFSLTFIDPTGWTGYEFQKVGAVLKHRPGEVLLNYMFDFINRFTAWNDSTISATFEGILGSRWQARLDASLPRHQAVEALFLEQFRKAGDFLHVVSTPIEKIDDRTHFCITYGTRNSHGLEAYRDIESSALKNHQQVRAVARQARTEARTGQPLLFEAVDLGTRTLEAQAKAERTKAAAWIEAQLQQGYSARFEDLWPPVLETFMLRVTDVKDICCSLAKQGLIADTWSPDGKRKPREGHVIGPMIVPAAPATISPDTVSRP